MFCTPSNQYQIKWFIFKVLLAYMYSINNSLFHCDNQKPFLNHYNTTPAIMISSQYFIPKTKIWIKVWTTKYLLGITIFLSWFLSIWNFISVLFYKLFYFVSGLHIGISYTETFAKCVSYRIYQKGTSSLRGWCRLHCHSCNQDKSRTWRNLQWQNFVL